MKLKLPSILICTIAFIWLTALAATPLMGLPEQSLVLPGIGTLNVSQVEVEAFDQVDAWEHYSSPSGVELGVENGIYREYTANPGYVWGLNDQEQSNVVTDVEVTPLTPFQDNGAGIMCRADKTDNGNGYYFMINANGYYSVQLGTDEGITPLIDWQASSAIHTGIDKNTIRAVCVDNQLAMYVNDEPVATLTDDTYSSGYAGLAVAAGDNAVDMSFDNLTLYTIESKHN